MLRTHMNLLETGQLKKAKSNKHDLAFKIKHETDATPEKVLEFALNGVEGKQYFARATLISAASLLYKDQKGEKAMQGMERCIEGLKLILEKVASSIFFKNLQLEMLLIALMDDIKLEMESVASVSETEKCKRITTALATIASCQLKIDEKGSALETQKERLKRVKKTHGSFSEKRVLCGLIYSDLANCYKDILQLKEAAEFYQKAKTVYVNASDIESEEYRKSLIMACEKNLEALNNRQCVLI